MGMRFANLKKIQCEKYHQTLVSKQKWELHFCKVKENVVKESVNANQCEACLKLFSYVFNNKRHEKVCFRLIGTKQR